MSSNKKLNIGIDIGATKIVVAGYHENEIKPSILLNVEERRSTIMCVAFIDQRRLLGFAAAAQETAYPEGVIFGRGKFESFERNFNYFYFLLDVKFVLGEDDLPEINPIYFPLQIVHDEAFGAVFKLDYNATTIQILPEQVIAILLKYIRENIVNQFPDCEIGNCVITVPFIYSEAKISAIINACIASGFDHKNVDIINSSLAAAITYYMERYEIHSRETKYVMIFDMGALTIDYTLVSMNGSTLKVELSGGKLNFGGDQFTQVLIDYFLSQLDLEERNILKENKRTMARLRQECEEVKRKLSLCHETIISLPSLNKDGRDIVLPIDQQIFEKKSSTLSDKIITNIVSTLKDSPEINEFIIIGGGARIPFLQEKLKNLFSNSKFLKTLNQDESAAIGAAYYATKLLPFWYNDAKLNDFVIEGYNRKIHEDVSWRLRSFLTVNDNFL